MEAQHITPKRIKGALVIFTAALFAVNAATLRQHCNKSQAFRVQVSQDALRNPQPRQSVEIGIMTTKQDVQEF